MQAVMYDHFGDDSVLSVREAEVPQAAHAPYSAWLSKRVKSRRKVTSPPSSCEAPSKL